MGIPISIAGLNQFVRDVPDGNMLLIEGESDVVISQFAQFLGRFAQGQGRDVTYVTSRGAEDIPPPPMEAGRGGFEILEEPEPSQWTKKISEDSVLIVDSFSFLMIDSSLAEVNRALVHIRSLVRRHHAVAVLTIELGMLSNRTQTVIHHLADSILQFNIKEGQDGVLRFIRIPKWAGWRSVDRNIYYNIDSNNNINVDLRSRVV